MNLRTAILLVAPHEVQAIAVPILQRYASATLRRVPAHLTIMYPFVPVEKLGEACRQLPPICGKIQPFEVTMRGYNHFPKTTWMQPVDPTPIQATFAAIFAHFPDYPPYEGQFGNQITPHMTVGEFESEADQHAAILPNYAPITFKAERLHVMYGPPDQALPWITYAVIPLGKEAT